VEGSTDPLTIKAFYVTGLISHLCHSVNILLDPKNLTEATYYPAYGVFASADELVGRCIRGNIEEWGARKDLTAGFQWVAQPLWTTYAEVVDEFVIVKDSNFPHTISDLVALRNFAAHGQAVNQSEVQEFDYLVLGRLQPHFAAAMEAYLALLVTSDEAAANLARANISPFRGRPILDGAWPFAPGPDSFPRSVGEAIRGMDWNYKNPLASLIGS